MKKHGTYISHESRDLTYPLVSIILPTYNRCNFIENAINSVLQQNTRYTFEILVIDDASSDETEDVVKNIVDNRLIYIKLEKNCGGGLARNIGINKATGKYIAFIDSDTTWNIDKLEKQVLILEQNESIDGCFTKFTKQSKKGDKILPRYFPESTRHNIDILYDNFIDTPTSIVKKTALTEVGGFDADLPRFQDWELFIRLCQKHIFIGLNESLINSLDLEDSISRNHRARATALDLIFNKHYDLFKENPKAYSRIRIKIVNSLLIVNSSILARQFIKSNTSSISLVRYKLLLLTLFPAKLFRYLNEIK